METDEIGVNRVTGDAGSERSCFIDCPGIAGAKSHLMLGPAAGIIGALRSVSRRQPSPPSVAGRPRPVWLMAFLSPTR
jgi:hypothetical protein